MSTSNTMKRATLHIQCVHPSGYVGDFLTDIDTREAISPVFHDLRAFYQWADMDGWVPAIPYSIYNLEFAKDYS